MKIEESKTLASREWDLTTHVYSKHVKHSISSHQTELCRLPGGHRGYHGSSSLGFTSQWLLILFRFMLSNNHAYFLQLRQFPELKICVQDLPLTISALRYSGKSLKNLHLSNPQNASIYSWGKILSTKWAVVILVHRPSTGDEIQREVTCSNLRNFIYNPQNSDIHEWMLCKRMILINLSEHFSYV